MPAPDPLSPERLERYWRDRPEFIGPVGPPMLLLHMGLWAERGGEPAGPMRAPELPVGFQFSLDLDALRQAAE